MRFSSDEEFFEQNQEGQQQNAQISPKKKEKKETMLSKFLESLDQNVMIKLHNYEKLKRPIFQRRAMVPQKLTLYEDVLFITVFKERQQKILSDPKQVRAICLDLQSRTKRKECTIRERVQKKLCKLSAGQVLEHVAKDKDISFNLKKVLTSGAKIESQKCLNTNGSPNLETKQKMSEKSTPKKQSTEDKQFNSESKKSDNASMRLDKSPSKQSEQIFEEKEDRIIEEQKNIENDKNLIETNSLKEQQYDENQIFIVFKKDSSTDDFLMLNNLLIHKEIMEMKKKQQEAQQKEELMKQLRLQVDIITHFRNQSSTIPPSIESLINEAYKIMQVLGIESMVQVQQEKQETVHIEIQKSQLTHQDTADRNNIEAEPSSAKVNQPESEISGFNIQNHEQIIEKKIIEEQPKYAKSYALCENYEYINLYNSNPQVFEPLLWTSDEDGLVDQLIEDFKTNEKLFNLLIRYKGPEMFIERCIFLNKNISNPDLVEAIKTCKPLNLNRLNNHIAILQEQNKMNEGQKISAENISQMPIEC